MKTSTSSPTAADPRWAAVLARDEAADGSFFYSVRTTGVYCRPSCASRPALARNVRFHVSAAEAEREGFRPCKRCKPDEPPRKKRDTALVLAACRTLERTVPTPRLATLARTAGMSPFHFHRVFRSVTGVTPRAYAAAHRSKRATEALASGTSVTEALHAAGYGSSGRFYEAAPRRLGMTPTELRAGGKGQEIRFAVGECSLGSILVAQSARGVCAIFLGDDPAVLVRDLEERFSRAHLVGGDAKFEKTVAKVVGLVEEPRQGFDLPLDVRGTAFQQRVWRALVAIPPGKTATYAEIARTVGAPKAARAVAAACAANPVAVAIPCHRVVRTGGALSGYRWGVERKSVLLAREADES